VSFASKEFPHERAARRAVISSAAGCAFFFFSTRNVQPSAVPGARLHVAIAMASQVLVGWKLCLYLFLLSRNTEEFARAKSISSAPGRASPEQLRVFQARKLLDECDRFRVRPDHGLSSPAAEMSPFFAILRQTLDSKGSIASHDPSLRWS